MKDIKVITRHAPSNYGSLLQSIATITVIRRLGHKCQIIDYQRKDERGLNAVLSVVRNKHEWNNNFLKKIIYVLIRFPMEYWAQCRFDYMRTKYLDMTKICKTKEDLSMIQADIFMTGSDQVWGPVFTKRYDEAYFLSFTGRKTKKVAFAASFGRTDFNNKLKNDYIKLLSKYDSITVREKSAVELLNEWGISCLGQVLDPTLLLTEKEWCRFISNDIKRKYVLVYQIHKNKSMDKFVKVLSKEVGLPLVRISPNFHQIFKEGKFVYLPSLGKFLSYIKNCTYLITDSFHGTAFALNFNKQFVEILPENKTSSRNFSILQLTNLTDRIISDYSDCSIIDRRIDYSRVSKIINKEREKSINILMQMIDD